MPSVDRKNSLLNLGHELKILNYLGPNANVIPQIGLIDIAGVPFALFEMVMTATLFDYSQDKRFYRVDVVKWIIKHLTSAISFLHSKNIIFNNLIKQSIYMREEENSYWVPVLADFSYACHADGAKLLTKQFQKIFAKTKHLPVPVLLGKQKPSFSSDIFSLGHMISHFASGFPNGSERLFVEHVAFILLNNKEQQLPQEHYDLIL